MEENKSIYMIPIIVGALIVVLCGCTTSLTIIHTQGEATDVVDETQSPKNDVSPEISIPAKVI